MTTPDFVLELRKHIGHDLLWMPGVTGIVVRADSDDLTALDPADLEILVVRRSDNGMWTPVTGIVDPGEEPAAALVREVAEEAGVRARPLRLVSTEVVGPMTYPNGDRAVYLDTAFLLIWEDGEPWPADGENTEARFVRGNELPEMNERFMRVVERALSGREAAAFEF